MGINLRYRIGPKLTFANGAFQNNVTGKNFRITGNFGEVCFQKSQLGGGLVV